MKIKMSDMLLPLSSFICCTCGALITLMLFMHSAGIHLYANTVNYPHWRTFFFSPWLAVLLVFIFIISAVVAIRQATKETNEATKEAMQKKLHRWSNEITDAEILVQEYINTQKAKYGLVCLLLIPLLLFTPSAKALTQDEVVNQFKDDQIECLKHKVSLNEGLFTLLSYEGLLLIKLGVETDTEAAQKYVEEIKATIKKVDKLLLIKKSDKYACTDDDDDKFLDALLGPGVDI